MENAIKQLAEAIEQTNTQTNWIAWVSAICSIISLTTVAILLIERHEKKRPYLQVSFELIKSSLVCLVIRNVGEIPLKLHSICFNPEFVNQLPPQAQQNALDKANLNVSIFPGKQWVLCLEENAHTVMKYQNTILEITCSYSAKGKRKRYRELEMVEFKDYSGFLVYISEIDELKNEIQKLGKSLGEINKELSRTYGLFPREREGSYSLTGDATIKNMTSIPSSVLASGQQGDEER